jgi:23S rRNA pseudouridine1911/1915/1917 synthase
VIHGVPKAEEGTVIGAIGRHPSDRKKYAVVSEGGRHACTHWRLVERLGDYSLLRFKLDTGRTHQIRVHCAHMGHPIVGDITYSRCRKVPMELPGQALHAVHLGMNHPISGERLLFEAPLPAVFERLLVQLRRRMQTGAAIPPGPLAMAAHNLHAFIAAVLGDPALQQQLSTTAAADADEVAAIARAAGFELSAKDLVSHADGALVEYHDEDYFMKPSWWELAG